MNDEQILQIAEQYLILEKDSEDVIKAIKASIENYPEENGTKYLIVAETLHGQEAVEYFKKGIEVLIKDKSNQEENKTEDQINIPNKIASAFSSIAELYMTPPLCDQSNAEQICEESLIKALSYEELNIDALQCLANLRILRARDQEAIELLEKVVKNIREKSELTDPIHMPPIEFRMQTCRLLLELGSFKNCVRVLDTIIKEEDTKGEVWYLLAFSHYNLQKYQNASECIVNALDCADITEDIKDA